MIIAVDFDGTIIKDNLKHKDLLKMSDEEISKSIHYELMPDAKESIRVLSTKHELILWTVRDGSHLEKAIKFLKTAGMMHYFTGINENAKNIKFTTSNKIFADCYIDDKVPGGFPGWKRVLKYLGE